MSYNLRAIQRDFSQLLFELVCVCCIAVAAMLQVPYPHQKVHICNQRKLTLKASSQVFKFLSSSPSLTSLPPIFLWQRCGQGIGQVRLQALIFSRLCHMRGSNHFRGVKLVKDFSLILKHLWLLIRHFVLTQYLLYFFVSSCYGLLLSALYPDVQFFPDFFTCL